MIDRITADLEHRSIERAKEMFKAESCDMAFADCLEHAAAQIVPAIEHMRWRVTESDSGIWCLTVWWEPPEMDERGAP